MVGFVVGVPSVTGCCVLPLDEEHERATKGRASRAKARMFATL
jgi:hypothetical protein